ncbi:hypothetical protein TYRP_016275, partial [Tyrophagus putrescentiae]
DAHHEQHLTSKTKPSDLDFAPGIDASAAASAAAAALASSFQSVHCRALESASFRLLRPTVMAAVHANDIGTNNSY